ncbi:MAG: 50S ribosomal protein L2 [Bacteroidetes bacterium SW_8_64_56]|jgi:large subunit ribosomal protein L2|nr:MAG: 50S ribosomal protein L2 [Bacteroidetes bacterium QH_2_64_74]PSQ67935.1 MAG: 50S ribosomal protein L2 [Bacteroidetes bacterium QH_1_64_81]PSQ73747.1 MAG: 50S ribosomal protein L2 [Bacteroidetes bacterium QH_6_64_77]PSQ74797.1 MAG: 50S ribosomal protein L2 [Bacteroidetes bacterium QH_7_64_110]PSQ87657.1 MAG: 50S ribosomal protein L2 [Bacteroidetes bacterium QS_4_64_154]PSQ99043.1 MAG: 50S ribosomal protein L2 [Bacteroidetes bacterium SW_7_64_58]PSR03556.1 MAG: 50S ribosomal protein L2 
MSIKKRKPTINSQRQYSVDDKDDVTTTEPERSLLEPLTNSGGRNNQGRMTMRYRGGGHKRRYREIDFKRSDKDGIPATVKTIEYDPNRSARISLLAYADGEKRYIIAPDGLEVGDTVMNGPKARPEVGNCLPLSNIPLGTQVHCIEMRPGKGAQLARAAGTHAQLTAREDEYATLELPSGETRLVPARCRATVGTTSNVEHENVKLGKAGRKRWLGRRPRTRGVAMNPIDHPMGGGEGLKSGGHPRSRKGVPAKGYKTRKRNKESNKYIIRRRTESDEQGNG